jgi:transposase-like protein
MNFKRCTSPNTIETGFVRKQQMYRCWQCFYPFTNILLRGKPMENKLLCLQSFIPTALSMR